MTISDYDSTHGDLKFAWRDWVYPAYLPVVEKNRRGW
jgi:hypothetical protein